jgi:hypothetical protein
MKTMGIAAGALALASGLPAYAQTAPENPPPATENPPPATLTPPPAEPPSVEVQPPATAKGAEEMMPSKLMRAPSKAFELGVDGGYTQGFGRMQSGRGVGDVAGAGGTLGVNLGYRIDPRWSVAVNGRYEGFGSGQREPSGTTVRGASAGIQGTYHTAPWSRLDPYLSFGAGYRALMETPQGKAPTTVTHGFELARVELGLDLRASENVSISPVLGADLNMFMWRTGGGAETASLTDRGVSTFVFAGVKGRFDFGGSREAKPAQQVGSRLFLSGGGLGARWGREPPSCSSRMASARPSRSSRAC